MNKLCPTFVFLIVMLLVVSVPAQSHIQRTPDGGYIILGLTASPDVEQRGSGLIKINQDKSVDWAKVYQKSSREEMSIASIDPTEDGGFILAGSSSVPETRLPKPSQALVLKLDQNGNPIWQKELKKEAYQCYLGSVIQTEEGGYIASGHIAPVPPEDTKNADMDGWVVKLTRDGSVEWQYSYRGDSVDWAHAIIQTEDSGYLFVGETPWRTGQKSAGDLWVVKLDKKGLIEWQKTYGEPYEMVYLCADVGYSAIQMENKDYLVVGTTRSFKTGGGAQGDIWILRLDNKGNIKWQKAYGGVCLDTTPILTESISGGYFIGGSTSSFAPWKDISITEDTCYTQQIWNGLLFEIDRDGKLVWQKAYGTEGYAAPSGIAQIAKKGYFIAGLVSQQFKVFQIDETGNLREGLGKLNIAPTDITPQITTTKSVESTVIPEHVQVSILNLDLEVTEIEVSDIFLGEK